MYCSFFDVDGVLLDFEGGFIKAIKDYFQLDIPDDFSSKSFWFSAPPFKMLKDSTYQENRCRLRLEDVWSLL